MAKREPYKGDCFEEMPDREVILLEDFIGIFDNALEPRACDELIQVFKAFQGEGKTMDRLQAEKTPRDQKDDEAMGLYGPFIKCPETNEMYINEYVPFGRLFDSIYNCCHEYTAKWSLLPHATHVGGGAYKIQKTEAGQGYHVWHAEAASHQPNRVLVWTAYLNDIDETAGGETEFLYYRHKCRPKKGRIMIWPAQFTHAHRGATYWGKEPKMIATGWLHYRDGCNVQVMNEDKKNG